MKKRLKISGDLEHDGDGVVKIYFEVSSECFSGMTAAWATEPKISELVSVLAGFPAYTPSEISYTCGGPQSGQFKLRVTTIDNIGHCAAWIQLTAEYEADSNGGFESALICLQITAAAIDRFCLQLREFKRGNKNEATLSEDAL